MYAADNQRNLLGKGHLNWPTIIQALKGINFNGYFVLEYIPPHADPYFAFRKAVDESVYDEHARYAIEFIKKALIVHGFQKWKPDEGYRFYRLLFHEGGF